MGKAHFDGHADMVDDAIGDAETMKLRSTLVRAIERHIRAQGCTQTEAARRLGVTQPRISDLMRGKIHLFTLDSLVKMAVAAGLGVEVHLVVRAA